MKNLKIWGAAFLMGVGAARVLVWLNTGITHLLIMRGGWEVAEAVKAAPWILAALVGGLTMSLYSMARENERYTRSPYGKVEGYGARTKQDSDKEMGA